MPVQIHCVDCDAILLGLDVGALEHPDGGLDRLPSWVIEVALNGVDPGVGFDAFDLQSRNGDLDAVVRDCQDHRSLGLDVVKAGQVLDGGRTEPDAAVGRFVGQSVPDGIEP